MTTRSSKSVKARRAFALEVESKKLKGENGEREEKRGPEDTKKLYWKKQKVEVGRKEKVGSGMERMG
jgi:hypothetical protein